MSDSVFNEKHSYRPDIDGLRGVAVLAVVAYHVGIPYVAGGFTGVDIFYVISGFLITGLLLKDIEQYDRVQYWAFYARRALRILPAFLLVVITTVLASVIFLSRGLGEVQNVTRSAIATLGFIANYYFYFKINYFAGPSQFEPFLHMWSLAVEEQFYFAWPVLIGISWTFCRRSRTPVAWLFVVLLAVSILSLIYAFYLANSMPALAFYSSAARAWELGLGGLLAICVAKNILLPRAWAGSATFVGFSMICLGIALTSSGPRFPIPNALWPVLGATLFIAGNSAENDNVLRRLLSSAPMVQVGLVSYAWYLWHWPALALFRTLSLGHPNLIRDVLLAIATFALAVITVRFYERPLRFHAGFKDMSRRTVVAIFAGATACVFAFALTVGVWAKFAPLTPLETAANDAKHDDPPSTRLCLLPRSESPSARDQFRSDCLASGSEARLSIWGDSLADRITPAVTDWAKRHDAPIEMEQLTKAACVPVLHLLPLRGDNPDYGCQAFNDMVLRRFAHGGEIKPSGVILEGDWWPWATDLWTSRGLPRTSFDVRAANPKQALELFERGLRSTFGELEKSNLRVLIVLQTPVFLDSGQNFISVPDCIVRNNGAAEPCGVAIAVHRQYSKDTNSVIEEVAKDFKNVRVLDLTSALCDERVCPARIDGTIAYIDHEHLTATVARRLTPTFAPYLDWLVAPRSRFGQQTSGAQHGIQNP